MLTLDVKQPTPPPIRWDMHPEVEASDELEAIEIAAKQFILPASNLKALRR